ncbi:MAG TPA: STAS domain-containing protein [Anaerolineae bacterium]|jgi:anti-sigma B factor antagonist|nr:STAS domain-containing protein [Anaerolineae bacterium]
MSIWDESFGEGSWLVVVSGRLDQSQNQLLEEELQRLLDEGHHQLIVDLSDVTYVNSGGLRCLVTVWRQARERGGNVVLCGLSERLAHVFRIVGFDKVFVIYPSRADAERGMASEAGRD